MAEYKFEPFQKVLVRDYTNRAWEISLYGRYLYDAMEFPHHCLTGSFRYCIPYEGNEHLLGKSENPESVWLPEVGELVAVSNNGCLWDAQVFKGRSLQGLVSYFTTQDANGKESSWRYCEPIHKHFKVPK